MTAAGQPEAARLGVLEPADVAVLEHRRIGQRSRTGRE
jgi:hypothetical protein